MNSGDREVTKLCVGRPHVVILGAGASVAALPNGDKYGRRLPVMDDLVPVLELEELLDARGIEYRTRGFEDVYGDITARKDCVDLQRDLNERIAEYFGEMALPGTPTIYDYLVLSLRDKDVIATFNWDPFLFQACMRNRQIAQPPHVVFLHGNVAVGSCAADKVKGPVGSACFKCGRALVRARLLYPVAQKDYASDPYIASEWATLRAALGAAYVVTIFGYSAPASDVEAISLLQDAWGPKETRDLEEIEIIDLKREDELMARWDAFIHSHHYRVHSEFDASWIRAHPRRTCDAMWRQMMEIEFLSDNLAPADCSLDELQDWFEPLVRAEHSLTSARSGPA